MLCPMERKVGKYKIEAGFYIFDWIWYLIPTIQLSFDEVFFGMQIHFLCFNLTLDITNEEKFTEWEDRFDQESGIFEESIYSKGKED